MPLTLTRVRHETRFRRLTVLRTERLTPQMVRVHFASPDLAGFAAPGFDDHARLFFPVPGQDLPVPERGGRGLVWPDPAPAARDYTPRTFDTVAGVLAIDFVLHSHGVASDWAAAARPGDSVGMGGPRGSFLVEGHADHELLMGDATALPAIARRLEALPGGASVAVVVEVDGLAEELDLPTEADLDLTWLHAGAGQSLAAHAAGLALPPGEVFVFAAGEAKAIAAIRARLDDLGHPEGLRRLSNYWRQGVADDDSH
jgi:NADPH-dependent ferric siderophore reductase